MDNPQASGRYPYTYSADYMRSVAMDPFAGPFAPCSLSRGSAARLLTVMAEVIGFDRDLAARKLADAYCAENGIAAHQENSNGH